MISDVKAILHRMALLLAWMVCLVPAALPVAAQEFTPAFDAPKVALAGVPFAQTVRANVVPEGDVTLIAADQSYTIAPDAFSARSDGVGVSAEVAEVVVPSTGAFHMSLERNGETLAQASSNAIWGWLSVMPALLAIGIALVTRQVIPSLLLGVFIGAWMTYGMGISGLWFGFLDTIQIYIIEALAPPGGGKFHMQVVVFTLLMGGMIGIIYRNGGAHAIADRIGTIASNRKRGQLATCLLGFAVFFSDYANSLIVGNTMRPVTDKLKISREKLAYIVDSTAAPLATIAIISTWIGFQLGLIGTALEGIGWDEGAYAIFLSALPYNFYPFFALCLALAIGATGRDFGPMLKAERRAATEGKLLRDGADVDENASGEGGDLQLKEGVPQRSINAVLPIVALIATVALGLYFTGSGDNLREIVGSADGGKVLVYSGFIGVILAAALTIGQRLMTLGETVDAWYAGLKSVVFVMIILTLAWALSSVASDLHTANYLVSVLGDSISPRLLPAILFVLAAAVSFAVGTSWGTMGILMPLAVPLIWTLMQNAEMSGGEYDYILYATIGTILAGSVFGDHCSPISDTTIISSVAAGSDHIDHVRTQIPYAMTAGGLAIVVGLIPTGYGVPWWITVPLGFAAIFAILFMFGSPVEDDEEAETDEETEAA